MDSSDEEEQLQQKVPMSDMFDESIEVRNAEEIPSPVATRRQAMKRPSASASRGRSRPPEPPQRESPGTDLRRYSVPDESYNKSMGLDSETSESDDSEDTDLHKSKRADFYDPKQFEDLEASSEVKELFQNILRYTPQKIELQYKLIPFIPDYIPAVGDIDAFLKVPRPDGVPDRVGLTVLDEPATEQSEPAVLHLQMMSRSRSAASSHKTSAVVKRVEDAPRAGRMIDKWIEDMGQLQRSRHPAGAQLMNRFPHPDVLLQPWPVETEDKLGLGPGPDLLKLDLELGPTIDLVSALLDVPVYPNARIESLHTIFALYTEIHNIDIQKIHV